MVYASTESDITWDSNSVLLIVPVLADPYRHRNDNKVSFLYVYDFNSDQEWILNYAHSDIKFCNIPVEQLVFSKVTFCYNSFILKQFGHNTIDADLCYWLNYNKPIEVDFSIDISSYHRWYRKLRNINNIVPIVNFISYCRNIVLNFKEIFYDIEFDDSLEFYNHTVLGNLYKLEHSGIPCNVDVAREFYKDSRLSPILYSQYNIFTATGRPSNKFDGINYAALNKSSGVRKMISVSDPNELLLEFDYDSYHIRLVADLINYTFPEGNLHEYFGRQYFQKETLDDEAYEMSKGVTFRMLYGEILDEFRHIEFFQKVAEYRYKIYEKFQNDGYIKMPISGRKIKRANFENLSSTKLFNYILQGHETERNMLVLTKIFSYLYNSKSRLILYTYDSLLFVYNKQDGRNFIEDITTILNDNSMKVNLKAGFNFHSMKRREYK